MMRTKITGRLYERTLAARGSLDGLDVELAALATVGIVEPGDYGQMLLYLRWLDHNQRHAGDSAPIGLILCTEKGPEQVALLGLDSGEVRAAQYVTDEVRAGLERIAHQARSLED